MSDGHRPAVCVVGSFMMDLVATVPRRPGRGETVLGTGFEMFLGGKGFNQAVAAARCGVATSMVGRLGDDAFGQRFVARMTAEGIDCAHVSVDDQVGTGVGLPLVEESGENSIVVIPRANSMLSVNDVERASAMIAAADVLLLQLELPVEACLVAATIAKAGGTTVVLNPAPAPKRSVVDMFFDLVDVLVPNEIEIATLVTDGHGDAALAASHLSRAFGVPVALTLGERGCLVAAGAEIVMVAAHAVQAIDTVGAGDAFCGALGARLASGAGLYDAVEHANAAGALAVTKPGAEPAMPSAEAILELLSAGPVVSGRRTFRTTPG